MKKTKNNIEWGSISHLSSNFKMYNLQIMVITAALPYLNQSVNVLSAGHHEIDGRCIGYLLSVLITQAQQESDAQCSQITHLQYGSENIAAHIIQHEYSPL